MINTKKFFPAIIAFISIISSSVLFAGSDVPTQHKVLGPKGEDLRIDSMYFAPNKKYTVVCDIKNTGTQAALILLGPFGTSYTDFTISHIYLDGKLQGYYTPLNLPVGASVLAGTTGLAYLTLKQGQGFDVQNVSDKLSSNATVDVTCTTMAE